MIYIIVAVLQIIQSVLKVFEIKWSYEESIIKLSILSFFMNAIWIIGTAIGVSAVMNNDWLMMCVYVFSGVLGKILALTVFNKYNYRKEILSRLIKQNKV